MQFPTPDHPILRSFPRGSCCGACPLRQTLAAALAAGAVDTTSGAAALLLEHRGVSQHIGQDEVSDLRPAQVHLLQVRHLAVAAGDRHTFQHGVHVVLTVHQVASVHLSSL